MPARNNRQSLSRSPRPCGGGRRSAGGWRSRGQGPPAVGRDARSGRVATRPSWLGWLGITNEQLAHLSDSPASPKLHAGRASPMSLLLGMGGSSLGPEVMKRDVRQDRRLPGAARARFDRSGAGEGLRGQGRPRQDARHRLQQVGQDPRAEHLQAVFLRSDEARRRHQGGRQSFRRHHRSRLQDAEGGEGDGFRQSSRVAEHRRPLLGAVGLRPDPGRGHGVDVPGCWIGRRRWSGLHVVRAHRGEPRRSSSARFWARRSKGATSSPSWRRRH